MSHHPVGFPLPPSEPTPVTPVPEAGSDGIALSRFFGVLRRHWKLVLGLVLVGGIAGGILGYREPPTYQAAALLRLAGQRKALTGEMEATPQALSRMTDPLLSLVELIRSRSVIGPVVDSLGLQLKPDPKGFPLSALAQVTVDPKAVGDSVMLTFTETGVTATKGGRTVRGRYGDVLNLGVLSFAITRDPHLPEVWLNVVSREEAVDGLIATLKVLPRKETDVVDVFYAARDPRLAQQVVNTTVQSFQALNVRSATETSRHRREFLSQQLTQIDSMLGVAQSQLSTFRSRHLLASSQDRLVAEQNAMQAFEGRRSELQADRNTYGSLLQQLSARDTTTRSQAMRALASSPAIAENPTVSGLYQQLTVYQNRLDSATTGEFRSAETNPDVIQLRNLVKSSQQKLTEAFRSHVSALDARIASLGALRSRSGRSIEVLPAMAEEEMRLGRRVDALSKLEDEVRQDYQRARISEALEAGDVDVVDYASLPYTPLWATASLKLILGLLIGLVLGWGGAFLLEAMNTSIRRPEDLETMLHLPGLAVIPRLEPVGQEVQSRKLLKGRKKALPADGSPTAARPLSRPFSVGTEAFRMLRTSLIWSDRNPIRSVVVTSAAPGEGKTVTAANLAVAFAHDGLRVLIVDCDVRRPRLHGLFRVPRTPGLMELLALDEGPVGGGIQSLSFDPGSGRTVSGLPLTDVVLPTGIRSLSILPAGALPTNASSLLTSIRMRELLKQLGESFDLIVLDTPPVLATADAGILGGLTDGVLLVVRAGQTDRAAAQRAHQQLAYAGARVLGAVLNDPGGEVSQYGDYYYPYDYAAEHS